jgi:hypothetical protein
VTLDEQTADTIPPAPPTMPAPADKTCGCGAVHDHFDWRHLPRLGVMRDDAEAAELRNCGCGSTIAVALCIVEGCSERATWATTDLLDYCSGHAREWLMAEAEAAAA